jgi:hypothetical protein
MTGRHAARRALGRRESRVTEASDYAACVKADLVTCERSKF